MTNKYILLFFLCTFINISCHQTKKQDIPPPTTTLILPDKFQNKRLVKVSKNEFDNSFNLSPFFYRNIIETNNNQMFALDKDFLLNLTSVEELVPQKEWLIKANKAYKFMEYEPTNTLNLLITCIDEDKRLYKIEYDNSKEYLPIFNGYFMLADKDFEPTFYPSSLVEQPTKWDLIVDHRYPFRGIAAPSPIYFMSFYHVRDLYLKSYEDNTATQVVGIDSFIEWALSDNNPKKRSVVIANDSCKIKLPGFAKKFMHQYLLTKTQTDEESFDEYTLYVLIRFDERYYLSSTSRISLLRDTRVDFELNHGDNLHEPIVWNKNFNNKLYWQMSDSIDPCRSNGGFSITFTDTSSKDVEINKSYYAYIVEASKDKINNVLNIIPYLRWTPVKTVNNDNEIKILYPYILGRNDQSEIYQNLYYNEAVSQGLIEEEHDDFVPNDEE